VDCFSPKSWQEQKRKIKDESQLKNPPFGGFFNLHFEINSCNILEKLQQLFNPHTKWNTKN
jgi:hypothetical protein